MASTPQIYELLKRLNDAGVEYVVIGGVAAILQGSPRSTSWRTWAAWSAVC